MYDADEREFDEGEILPRYKVGEIVAVAQSYADIGIEPFAFCEAAWRNKMFVKAELMPYQIKITNVRIQRLQDISDEDCLREGIELNTRQYEYDGTKNIASVDWDIGERLAAPTLILLMKPLPPS